MGQPSKYSTTLSSLRAHPKKWLVTGAAGFIGSNLVEILLRSGQTVVGVDNFSTGFKENLLDVKKQVGEENWQRFQFFEGNIVDESVCQEVSSGVHVVLHQAALGSVPRSIDDPINSHNSNVSGFINMLKAAVDQNVSRFVYASSSSVYGDHPGLPKIESQVGTPLSPYAATKKIDEIYAEVFNKTYGIEVVGLRYFNVFGPRQSPEGPYAAVIPKWTQAILSGKTVEIFGDGETSRDFCYIENVKQANILAGVTDLSPEARVYNVSCGQQTTLNQLFTAIKDCLLVIQPGLLVNDPIYSDFRPGDVRHSLANIDRIRSDLGYEPEYFVTEGLKRSMGWYANHL